MTTDSGDKDEVKANPAWKIALVGGPVFLVLSTAWAMWNWWKQSQDTTPDPGLALVSSEVRAQELDDHLRKLTKLIGPRNWETPEGRKNMERVVAFLEGTLSPQNYGFEVKKGAYQTIAGELWPTVWVRLEGTLSPDEVVMVAGTYDFGDSALATILSAANDLRNEEFASSVYFVFYPGELYAEEEKTLTVVLGEEQSLRELLQPDLSEADGIGVERRFASGVDLKPVADDLVRKVRESAGEGGKMP